MKSKKLAVYFTHPCSDPRVIPDERVRFVDAYYERFDGVYHSSECRGK